MLVDTKHRHMTMESTEALKFTVNEIMLLQRLRRTGLTKHQIFQGLEEIEKLENLNHVRNGVSTLSLPLSRNSISPTGRCNNDPDSNDTTLTVVNKEIDMQERGSTPTSPRLMSNPNNAPHPLSQPHPLIFDPRLQNTNRLALLPTVGSWPNTSQAVAVATAASLLQQGFGHGRVPPPTYSSFINGSLGRGVVRNGGVSAFGGSNVIDVEEGKVDVTEELEELFRRDQAGVKEDIRKFINERHISQSAIAKATKNAISQSYISQWLAQPQDISGQKKKAMYTWFITEKRKPLETSHGCIQSVCYRNNDADQDGLNPMFLKGKRGARFTWPKECLSILENFYNANSYPDECKREEIAHACNAIIQAQKPVLCDLDKVTTVKVYNWFANRRKDDKRRRHIENVEAIGHQQAMMSPKRTPVFSPSPSSLSTDSHQDGEVSYSIIERMPGMKKEVVPMSLALEIAAANSSVLSLVKPRNDSASHDDDDDEHESAFERAEETTSPYHQNRKKLLTECQSYAA